MTITTIAPTLIPPTVEMVDAVTAKSWLPTNTRNRKISNDNVNFLVGIIRRGEWVYDGDPIRFDYNGVLLNGQHRLLAISATDARVPLAVQRGLAPESQNSMDTGKPRSFSDQLSIDGEKSVTLLAGATRLVWHREHGDLRGQNGKPSIGQLYMVLNANPDIRASVAWLQSNRPRGFRYPRPAVIAFCHFALTAVDAADAAHFFRRLVDGVGLAEDSPILHLRNTLGQLKSQRGTVPPWLMYALVVKAWNAFREGRSMRQLKFTAGGASPEAMPTPL
jgi:hypothetical protein